MGNYNLAVISPYRLKQEALKLFNNGKKEEARDKLFEASKLTTKGRSQRYFRWAIFIEENVCYLENVKINHFGELDSLEADQDTLIEYPSTLCFACCLNGHIFYDSKQLEPAMLSTNITILVDVEFFLSFHDIKWGL